MPPKKVGNALAEGSDATAAAVTALCRLIMSCDEFKADNSKLADGKQLSNEPFGSKALVKILGIAQAKNVPRKINSIINPYGFELKSGKIVAQSGTQAQDGAAGPAGAAANTSAAEEGKAPNKNKASKANGKAQQGPSKKRKLAVSFPDDDDNDHVKTEEHQEA
ncbi:hypothetical protein N8I77_001358 [Diaporthe amygdali]|uniref:Uncharacterized protein n=1 Tax=Phomopsis amygdali TaxID=1214568 RepID=A0AAD9SRH3_PHOAM|nr:hypothetical protein N8I77_001358 [Diaporthe amygdali]